MAETITVDLTTLTTVSGTANVHVADTATSGLYMRRYNDATDAYIDQTAGTNNGGGNWSFDLVDGKYQLWKSAYPDTTAGNRVNKWHGGAGKYRFVGDSYLPYPKKITDISGTYYECENLELRSILNPVTEGGSAISKDEADDTYILQSSSGDYVQTTGNQDIEDVKTFKDSIKVDFIDEDTAAAGVDIDGVVLKDSGILITQFNGNFSMAGYYATGFPTPLVGSGAANKSYVDARTRANSRVIYADPSLATDVPGQAYNTILEAVTYAVAQTPSATNQFTIVIEGMHTSGYITANAGSIQDYVHFHALARHIAIVFQDSSLTLTAACNISNATCYFGALDVASDRAFVKLNFYDCIIYHYKDLTLNSCLVFNTTIIGTGTKIVNYGGTTVLRGATFRVLPNELGGFTGLTDFLQWSDFVVPIDPSVPV